MRKSDRLESAEMGGETRQREARRRVSPWVPRQIRVRKPIVL